MYNHKDSYAFLLLLLFTVICLSFTSAAHSRLSFIPNPLFCRSALEPTDDPFGVIARGLGRWAGFDAVARLQLDSTQRFAIDNASYSTITNSRVDLTAKPAPPRSSHAALHSHPHIRDLARPPALY